MAKVDLDIDGLFLLIAGLQHHAFGVFDSKPVGEKERAAFVRVLLCFDTEVRDKVGALCLGSGLLEQADADALSVAGADDTSPGVALENMNPEPISEPETPASDGSKGLKERTDPEVESAILAALEQNPDANRAALARRYGVSRSTLYRILDRAEEEGDETGDETGDGTGDETEGGCDWPSSADLDRPTAHFREA